MTLDWLGWGDLPCNDQLYAVAVSAFAVGGWFVLTVEALFSSRGQRRTKKKARRKGRR